MSLLSPDQATARQSTPALVDASDDAFGAAARPRRRAAARSASQVDFCC